MFFFIARNAQVTRKANFSAFGHFIKPFNWGLALVFLLWGAATSKGQAPINCLNVSQTVNVATASEGDVVKYEITVCNTCGVAANNIAVSAALPRGLLFRNATGLNYANQTVSNTINLAANSCQTLKYEVLVLLATCNNSQNVDIRPRYRYNNFLRNANNSRFSLIDNSGTVCQPANFSYTLSQAIECGLLLPAAQAVNTSQIPNANPNNGLALGGNLLIDQNYTFYGSNFNMKAGSQINILGGRQLDIVASTVGIACKGCMWRGFVVESKAITNIVGLAGNLSYVQGAQYGFEAKNDAQITIDGVEFRANFVDIYMAPLNNPTLQRPQRLNLKTQFYRSSQNLLPKPFVGIVGTPVMRTNPNGGGLLNNPAPAFPIQGRLGLASIYVSDAEVLDIRTPNPSIFQKVEATSSMAGVVVVRVGKFLSNSTNCYDITEDAAYNNPVFGNIAWQGTGIYAQGIAGSTNYNVDITNIPSAITHNRCDNGVFARSVNMIVRGQNMRNISKAGITSRLATNCTVILESNQMNCQTTGIDLLFNDPAAKIEAKANSISVTPPSTSIGTTAAIRILENGNAYNNLDIQNNTLICNNARAQVGLVVTGHAGGKIFNNDVYLQGNANSPFFPNSIRTGIGLQNTNTELSCNNVNPSNTGIASGNNATGRDIMAINISGATGGLLSCNTVDKTLGGIRFENNNTMTVQGNVIQRHTYGLWITPNATLNNQAFAGNRFIGTNLPANGFEAYNQNFLGMQNQFQASFTADLYPASQFNALFSPPQAGNDFDCNIISQTWAGCGLDFFRLASIDARDRAIASNSYTPYNNADLFNNKKQLYKKLRRQPQLLQNEPILQQFDNTESQTNVGAFDWVEENTIAALRLDSIDSLQLQNYQQQAQALLDSMALLDSLQAWAGANNSQQRDNLSAQYDALLQQQRSYWQNIQAQRMQAIDMQLLPANQIIAANLDHETAEKLVNEIYLQTLAKGVDIYNSSQTQTLQIIAAQCPDELGTVVYKARAMYAMAAAVDMFDKSACNNSNNLELQPNTTNTVENNTENNSIILYPNPAQNMLILQSNISFAEGTVMEIYNSLGQLVQTKNLIRESQVVELNVSTLANGTYFVRVGNSEAVSSKLFIISK